MLFATFASPASMARLLRIGYVEGLKVSRLDKGKDSHERQLLLTNYWATFDEIFMR